MSRKHDEQAIALAGMFQAASLVDQIASRGMVSQDSFETSMYSLFQMNPDSTEAVFGEREYLSHNLSLGFKVLNDLVEKKPTKNNNVTNYVLSMVMLEKKLSAHSAMLKHLGMRIEEIENKAAYFAEASQLQPVVASDYTHSNIIAGLAGLYQETISTFSFRIQVGGDPRYLQNSENAAKIRALLLAGIRSATLWRQVGGNRWHLLFFRSRLRPSLKKFK